MNACFKTIYLILVFLTGFLSGCFLFDNPYISGRVTVSNESDWNTIKAGFFDSSSGGTDQFGSNCLSTENEAWTSDTILRLAYHKNNDGTSHEIAPGNTETSVTKRSALEGVFRIEIPPASNDTGGYTIMWLDADGDGRVDLVDDVDVADQISGSELSRCPVYDTGGYSVESFSVWEGKYKFSGFNDSTVYLDDADPTDFSFDMNPAVSGW